MAAPGRVWRAPVRQACSACSTRKAATNYCGFGPPRATVGNLERVTDGGSTVDYDYIQDRLNSQTAGSTVLATFLHDHAGRLTSRKSGATEVEGFAYDVEDHLKQVRRSGAVAEVLEYDPSGALLFRKVGTKAYYYVGPFATVTADVAPSCTGYGCAATNARVGVHVLLAGVRIATVRAPPAGSNADPAADVLYYHRDRQGSTVATTLTGGVVGVKYRYTPYGQVDKVEGNEAIAGSEIGYTGGIKLTGALVHLGARAYHADLKRWLQPDTVDMLRYTYAAGDPTNLIDPSGRLWMEGGTLFNIGGMSVPDWIAGWWAEEQGLCHGGGCNLMLGALAFDASVANTIAYIARQAAQERRSSDRWSQKYSLGNFASQLSMTNALETAADLENALAIVRELGPAEQQQLFDAQGRIGAATTALGNPSASFWDKVKAVGQLLRGILGLPSVSLQFQLAGLATPLSVPSVAVTFGHGARWLAGTGLSQAAVEQAIALQVTQNVSRASAIGEFGGQAVVNGQSIWYHAFPLPSGGIHVGTYYPLGRLVLVP